MTVKNEKIKVKKSMQSGQSMFEVVLALFIITMIIIAVVILSTNSIANSLFSRSKTQASRYSQEAIEWLRNERETDFEAFVIATNTPVYCLNTNPPDFSNSGSCTSAEIIDGTIFQREVSFSQSDVFSKSIIAATIITSWNDPKGYHEVRGVTEFSDIREK